MMKTNKFFIKIYFYDIAILINYWEILEDLYLAMFSSISAINCGMTSNNDYILDDGLDRSIFSFIN